MISAIALVLLASLLAGMRAELAIEAALRRALRKSIDRPRHAPSGTIHIDGSRVQRALAEAHAKAVEQHTEEVRDGRT